MSLSLPQSLCLPLSLSLTCWDLTPVPCRPFLPKCDAPKPKAQPRRVLTAPKAKAKAATAKRNATAGADAPAKRAKK